MRLKMALKFCVLCQYFTARVRKKQPPRHMARRLPDFTYDEIIKSRSFTLSAFLLLLSLYMLSFPKSRQWFAQSGQPPPVQQLQESSAQAHSQQAASARHDFLRLYLLRVAIPPRICLSERFLSSTLRTAA